MGEAREANPWLLLAGLSLGVLVTNGFGRFAYGLILPAMRADLGWTYAQAGWLNTANALGYILGAVGTMLALKRHAPARLFALGLVGTALALVATGLVPDLWWQSLWRFLTGLAGALSFSTAGALAARLWADNPKRNALGIAILFGSGGGSAIVLCGATLPPMLEIGGDGSWPWAWVIVGGLSLLCVPLGLWSALRTPPVPRRDAASPPLPLRRIWPEMAGYAGFGLGYIVYLTFLSAWMKEQSAGVWQVVLVWVLLGSCISLSPLLWRGVFARHAGGRPLALVLLGIAAGSALPVLWPSTPGLVASALVFGGCVFMAPGAVTNFTRRNLPPESWGPAISLFTVVFAVAQTVGPYAAGWLGDVSGSIGLSLLVASGLLLAGAALASRKRPLPGGRTRRGSRGGRARGRPSRGRGSPKASCQNNSLTKPCGGPRCVKFSRFSGGPTAEIGGAFDLCPRQGARGQARSMRPPAAPPPLPAPMPSPCIQGVFPIRRAASRPAPQRCAARWTTVAATPAAVTAPGLPADRRQSGPASYAADPGPDYPAVRIFGLARSQHTGPAPTSLPRRPWPPSRGTRGRA